jgi:hypothetical protein
MSGCKDLHRPDAAPADAVEQRLGGGFIEHYGAIADGRAVPEELGARKKNADLTGPGKRAQLFLKP